ncbi:MAG: hypothetical protein EA362_13260 [Saprospirales bacterium]|nr:MAG: hypothetical protein EA362_13260 [Saprospirales bacterium]
MLLVLLFSLFFISFFITFKKLFFSVIYKGTDILVSIDSFLNLNRNTNFLQLRGADFEILRFYY